MPSRVENHIPGQSSAVKGSSRLFDGAGARTAGESSFAGTLERLRSDKTMPAIKDAPKPAEPKAKARAAKSKQGGRAEHEASGAVDDRPTSEAAGVDDEAATATAEGDDNASVDDSAPVKEKSLAKKSTDPVEDESGDADNALLAAQTAGASTITIDPKLADATTDEEDTGDPRRAAITVVKAVGDDAESAGEATDEAGDVDSDTDAAALLKALGIDTGDEETDDATAAGSSVDAKAKPATDKGASDVAPEASDSEPVVVEKKKSVQPTQEKPESEGDASQQQLPTEASKGPTEPAKSAATTDDASARLAGSVQPAQHPVANAHAAPSAIPAAPAPSVSDFATGNHDNIVTSLRSTVYDKGGTMEIRLDPPELGALQVSVRMQDGVMTASFQTSNDEATRLLSHSLGQLKHVLESAGVTVDKLQVQQAPKNDHDGNAGEGRQQSQDDSSARQEQQRKEMIKRMWRKLSGGSDPLDLVA